MNKTIITSAVVGVLTLSGALSVANATTLGIQTTSQSTQEAVGDPGGSLNPNNPGLPQVPGGWNDTASFAVDSSTPGGPRGITGWDGSYLTLSNAANVTFQYMGAGNSDLSNSFWIFNTDPNDGLALNQWVQLFQDNVTTPCTVTDGMTPTCSNTSGGFATQNQYTAHFNAGNILFAYDIGGLGGPVNSPGTDWTRGSTVASAYPGATGNPGDASALPGYMLGVDPYMTSAPYATDGTAVYAGLSDRSRVDANGNIIDHDYQDMGVRISVSVPEPMTLIMLALGLIGFGYNHHRTMSGSKGLTA